LPDPRRSLPLRRSVRRGRAAGPTRGRSGGGSEIRAGAGRFHAEGGEPRARRCARASRPSCHPTAAAHVGSSDPVAYSRVSEDVSSGAPAPRRQRAERCKCQCGHAGAHAGALGVARGGSRRAQRRRPRGSRGLRGRNMIMDEGQERFRASYGTTTPARAARGAVRPAERLSRQPEHPARFVVRACAPRGRGRPPPHSPCAWDDDPCPEGDQAREGLRESTTGQPGTARSRVARSSRRARVT
jgi:hypothetical protein